ncbi:MAG: hypothetical protein JNL66_21240 [Alphaproteobacteria bacterium]|nr:hypothetical protein [Alphaproteobacteria bacterium]
MTRTRHLLTAISFAAIAALPLPTASNAIAREHGLQLAQGNSGNRGHGGGQGLLNQGQGQSNQGRGQGQGNSNTQSQGVDCRNPLNALHPNCRNNERSNAGGDLRGADRSNEVKQLNQSNGPNTTLPGTGTPGSQGRGRNR